MSKRIQDLKSPAAKWRTKVWDAVSEPLARLSEDQRFWLGFAFLCLVTTLLINNPIWRATGEQTYKEGDIAREMESRISGSICSIVQNLDFPYYVRTELRNRVNCSAAAKVPTNIIPNFFEEMLLIPKKINTHIPGFFGRVVVGRNHPSEFRARCKLVQPVGELAQCSNRPS